MLLVLSISATVQNLEINQLFEYCKKGKTQLLVEAISNADDYDIVDERGYSLFSSALKHGQWETAQTLIEKNYLCTTEKIPLISACQYRKDDIQGISLALLIDSDVNILNSHKRTALMTACLLGHSNKAEELVKQGASHSIVDERGNTALIEAVQSGTIGIVDFIIKLKPNINHTNIEGDTALLVAIKQKNPIESIIVSLLNANGDPEIVDENKKSAWLIAKQKHPRLSKTIEKHLNNINQIELPFFTNDYKTTPKEERATEVPEDKAAIENNRIEPTIHFEEPAQSREKRSQTQPLEKIKKSIVSPFNFKQKKVIKSNKQEWFHAARTGNLGSLNRMIIEGIDVNCVDDKGCSALIRACGHSRRAVVSFLLQQNTDIELRSNNGSTALSSSIIGNCRRVAGLLLDKGSNPNGVGPLDYPYVTIAAAQWNDAMLSILYRNKADVFIFNKQQQNLLHIISMAAEFYHNINMAKSSMQFLIDHGMEIDAQDSDGNTPLMLLCGVHKTKFDVDDRNIASIVHFLLKLGASAAMTNNTKKSAIDATRNHQLQQTKGVLMNALSWNE